MSLYYYYCPIIVDYLNFWLVVSPSGSAPAPLQVMPEELTSWKTHGPFTPAKECMMAWWAWFLIISYHTNSHHISSYHMYLYVFIIPQSIIIYISYHIYIYVYYILYICVCFFNQSQRRWSTCTQMRTSFFGGHRSDMKPSAFLSSRPMSWTAPQLRNTTLFRALSLYHSPGPAWQTPGHPLALVALAIRGLIRTRSRCGNRIQKHGRQGHSAENPRKSLKIHV